MIFKEDGQGTGEILYSKNFLKKNEIMKIILFQTKKK